MPTRLVATGGSDAGISAALRAPEPDPSAQVIVVLADAYPNYSICGIPYYGSGEVPDWHNLAHRTVADLNATGMTLRLDTVAQHMDAAAHRVTLSLAAMQLCERVLRRVLGRVAVTGRYAWAGRACAREKRAAAAARAALPERRSLA